MARSSHRLPPRGREVYEPKYLRPQMLAICRTYAEELSYRATAHKLGLSRHTVKNSLYASRRLYGAQTTVQLLMILIRRGIIK